MEEKWIIASKKADFQTLANQLHVNPILVRLMRNRGLTTYEEMNAYLNGDLRILHDPHLLKDADKAVDIIKKHIREKHLIMVANDFDCDGISSGYILESCIRKVGGDVYVDTPDRIADGYGINARMIEEAAEKGVKLIITCDNGIAAFEAAELAVLHGIDLIITDHHEVQFKLNEKGEKVYQIPPAEAVVNPKQEDCKYPFKGICGAVVAFKVMQILLESCRSPKYQQYIWNFLEIAAMATVADVMELQDENRIIVKYGLEQMKHTKNLGLKLLMKIYDIKPESLSAYHIGFVIGPCLNASGRLSTAKKALELLNEQDYNLAMDRAEELKELNEERKQMTIENTQYAIEIVEKTMQDDKILVVLLEDCHESIAGIVAGKLKEHFNRPAIVLTITDHGLKGSGRSIPAYDIFSKVSEHKDLLTRFGGHPMACGLSMKPENLFAFRKALNEDCGLTEEDLTPIIHLDMQVPMGYLTPDLVREIERLAPFGNGNPKPLFADRNVTVIENKILGKNQNVLKMRLRDSSGYLADGICFGDIHDLFEKVNQSGIRFLMAYEPSLNEFHNTVTVQDTIRHYRIQE